MVSLTADLTYLWFYLFLDQKCLGLFPPLPLKSSTFFYTQLKYYPLCVAFPDRPSCMSSLIVPNSSGITPCTSIIVLIKPLMHIGIRLLVLLNLRKEYMGVIHILLSTSLLLLHI